MQGTCLKINERRYFLFVEKGNNLKNNLFY